MKYTREHLQRFIDEIQENGVGVTKFEENFVQSLNEQLEAGRKLSDRQVELLDRIYAERTP